MKQRTLYLQSIPVTAFGFAVGFAVATGACQRETNKQQSSPAARPDEVAKSPGASPLAEPAHAADATSANPAAPADPMDAADEDMKEVLSALQKLGPKPIESLTPEEARKQPSPADAVKAVLKADDKPVTPEEVAKVEERTIPITGGTIPARVYWGKGDGPLPLVVYYHGGGFVIATNDTYDATPRALANEVKAVVVSVEYRKAPEHKFPAAHDDAFAAYQWATKNAKSLGADGKRVALVGESAGGNLAANVAIQARDKKVQAPQHVVLVYPVASNDLSSASYVKYANAKPLNKPMMGWFTEQYFRTPADANDPRINLVAADLKGLPPTTIINAEIDPLTTDGERLEAKLRDAGVSVERKVYEGVTHEFFGMGAVVSDAKAAVDYASDRIEDGFEAAEKKEDAKETLKN